VTTTSAVIPQDQGINGSDQNIRRPRGRPPGSPNKRPAKPRRSFTIRDVPQGTQAMIAILAGQAGITQGELLALAVSEYAASRSPTRNQKRDAKLDEVRRLFGIGS
jgi:hypothetical protein